MILRARKVAFWPHRAVHTRPYTRPYTKRRALCALQDQAQSEQHGPALDVLLKDRIMCHAFDSAYALFARTLERCRMHGHAAAALAQTPAVRHATECLLGIPKWRPLLQPMLAACVVRGCTQ